MTEVNKNIDNGKNKMGYAFFQIPSGETWTFKASSRILPDQPGY